MKMCASYYKGSDQIPADSGGTFLSQFMLVKSDLKALSLPVHGTDRTQQWQLSSIFTELTSVTFKDCSFVSDA